MKKRWSPSAIFDSWTKRIAAGSVAMGIIGGAGLGSYNHFAKAWEVSELRYRIDKRDYLEIRRQIAQLEADQKVRALTPNELEWLQQLRELEREFLEQMKNKK